MQAHLCTNNNDSPVSDEAGGNARRPILLCSKSASLAVGVAQSRTGGLEMEDILGCTRWLSSVRHTVLAQNTEKGE